MASGGDIFGYAVGRGCPQKGAALLALWLAPLPVAGNGWPSRAVLVVNALEVQMASGELDFAALDLPFADLKIRKTHEAARGWLESHLGDDAMAAIEGDAP